MNGKVGFGIGGFFAGVAAKWLVDKIQGKEEPEWSRAIRNRIMVECYLRPLSFEFLRVKEAYTAYEWHDCAHYVLWKCEEGGGYAAATCNIYKGLPGDNWDYRIVIVGDVTLATYDGIQLHGYVPSSLHSWDVDLSD